MMLDSVRKAECTHKVAVGICTYNRPASLNRLISTLDKQRLLHLADSQVVIIVIDNSNTGAAQSSCNSYARGGRFRLSCVSEPRKGLSFARNSAILAAVESGATHLAFIDDDEVPDSSWLDELYCCMVRAHSAAAIGPVYPIFEAPPPKWLPTVAFVVRRAQKNGFVSDAYTGNSIVALSAISSCNLRFDTRYNHTGGEDTLFFKKLIQGGGTIAWAENAIAREMVPQYRMTARWLWWRWFRTGALEADLGPYDPGSAFGKLVNFAMGLARIGLGSARVVRGAALGVLGKPEAFIASFYTMCRGMGLIAKVFGREYSEYSVRTHW